MLPKLRARFFGICGVRSTLALWLAGSLIIVGAYSCVFALGPYGYGDDYMLLYRVGHGDFGFSRNEQLGMGRPLAAALFYAAFHFCATSVQKLVWLRVFSLFEICIFLFAFGWTLRRAGCSRRFAFTAALLLTLSPAFGVYAAWATACFSPLALLISLSAGLLVERSAAAERSHRWRWWLMAGGLIWLVCNLWQVAAPFALFPSFAAAWKRLESSPHERPAAEQMGSGLWISGLILAASVAVYFAIYKISLRLGWLPSFGSDRGTFSTDLAGKFQLLVELMRSGFTSWGRFHPGVTEWALGVLTAGCCACATVRIQPGRRLLLVALMLFAAVSPLLAARENNAAYRTLGPLYAVIIFLALDGLRRVSAGRLVRWRTAGIAALLLAAVGASYYHVRLGLVEPNRREYRETRRLIRKQFVEPPRELVYLLPPYTLLARGMTPSWEYGVISSPFWWMTKSFLLVLFEDLPAIAQDPARRGRLAEAELTIHYRKKGNPGLPVLDPMPALLRGQRTWRNDPVWGRLRVFAGGWAYSPWFGYLNVGRSPVLQHHLLGNLILIDSKGPGEVWLRKDGLGTFFTSKEVFPNLYLSETEEWVVLADDNGDPGHIYQTREREWRPFPKN